MVFEPPPRIPPSNPLSWSSELLEELGAGELDEVWDSGVSVGVAGTDEELELELEPPPKIPPRRPPFWSSEVLEELGAGVDELPESSPRRPPSRPPSLSSLELGAGLFDVVGSGEDGTGGDVGDGEAGSDVSSVGVTAADEAEALETAVSEVQIELVTVEAPAGALEGVPVMVCV